MRPPTAFPPNTRQVRRLSLRAAERDQIGKAATAIEDALRTATLPGADQGRWLIIRRLDLGRLPAGSNPTLLSLHIEKTARSLRSQSVPFHSPHAASANVIEFPSHAEALIQLAHRHLLKLPVTEWFWSKLLPAHAPQAHTPQALNFVLNEILLLPNAPQVISPLIELATRSNQLPFLASQLSHPHLEFWYRRSSIPFPPPTKLPPSTQPLFAPPLPQSLAVAIRQQDPADPRTHFIALCALAAHSPRSSSLPSLSEKATIRIAKLNTRSPADLKDQPKPRPQFRSQETSTTQKEHSPPYSSLHDNPEIPPTEPSSKDNSPAALPKANPDLAPQPEPASNSQPLSSNLCGIVFIIPILKRLGFTKYLENTPHLADLDFPIRLLTYILQQLETDPSDPLIQILNDRCQSSEPIEPTHFELWFNTLRKWTKKRLDLPLNSLIARRGFIRATETHLDLFFDFAQADIRIRRQALDVSPGWTAYLAWAISIHYIDTHELDT